MKLDLYSKGLLGCVNLERFSLKRLIIEPSQRVIKFRRCLKYQLKQIDIVITLKKQFWHDECYYYLK